MTLNRFPGEAAEAVIVSPPSSGRNVSSSSPPTKIKLEPVVHSDVSAGGSASTVPAMNLTKVNKVVRGDD